MKLPVSDRQAIAMAFWREGTTVAVLAQRYKVSTTLVGRYVHQYRPVHITTRTKKPQRTRQLLTTAQQQQLADSYWRGLAGADEIASYYGVSRTLAYEIIERERPARLAQEPTR